MKNLIRSRVPCALACLNAFLAFLAAPTLDAQTFSGTNAPGQGQTFNLPVASRATNLSLVVSNSPSSYAYLFVKSGGIPTPANYDFTSRLVGLTNQINLESPEFVAAIYGLLVTNPPTSATQSFNVVMTTNRSDLRSAAYPVSKPLVFSTTGFLTNSGAGAWHYFQVDVPTNLPTGWRLVVSSASVTPPALYVRRGQLPTTGSYDFFAAAQAVATVTIQSAQATNGTYFVGVYLPSGASSSANYALGAELISLTPLTWDPGTTDSGTQVYTNQSTLGGDYFFSIVTQAPADGVWRTALNVQSGQASVYLTQGSLPTTTSYSFGSANAGSNGFVIPQAQFSAGQNWYYLVHATPGAQWNLVSGEAYVQQLPPLAADASSGSTNSMGAEGMHFYKTTITTNTLAWRLAENGLSKPIYVKSSAAPTPLNTSTYDLVQSNQMLVVPTYLSPGNQYFVGVAGSPGQVFTLDSRQQPVTSISFNSTSNLVVTGYGYTTFVVQVPVQQIAWQVTATPISGNANVAVRRNNVPNEFVNDAFSEAPASVASSLALVPPTLANGTFYITVYGTAPYTISLFNGQPVITPVNYVFAITNDQPNQVGWRYYTVTDTSQQLGSLGWEIDLSNAPIGAEIALRRNAVPGQWNYRNNAYDYYGYSSQGYVDLSSMLPFLQQPNHPADVWYIGVYSPAAPLSNFVLSGSQLTGPPVSFDSANNAVSVTNQPAGKFQYFTFTVPTNAFGWDLRLTNITSGSPVLYLCRDQLPAINGPGFNGITSPSWPSGYQWQASYDWTGTTYNADGSYAYNSILAMGMGNPLQPGTYYAGIYNNNNSGVLASYWLSSRGIGTNFTIPITPLSFSNGVVSSNLVAREAAYYSLVVPSNMPSWRVELDTNIGDALLVLQKDALPNVEGWIYNDPPYFLDGGREMNKVGNDQYLMLPINGQSNITAGNYYLAVVSDGTNFAHNATLGSGFSSYTLGSYGTLSVSNLGVPSNSGLSDVGVTNLTLPAGQVSAYTFSVPSNTLSLEIFLTSTTGNPYMTLRTGGQFPGVNDSYGVDGGWTATWASSSLINIANPAATNYTLMVQAEQAGGDSTYTLRVHAIGPQPIVFDNGTASITNQGVGLWQYFYIVVPSNTFGWDLRLTNISGTTIGQANYPQLYVSRDVAPSSGGSGFNGITSSSWPSGYQWQAAYDWTATAYNADGSYAYSTVLAMGMGNPLQAGNYYVGVYNNSSGTNLVSYTLWSRGIGTNFTIPITPLAFSNGVISSNLLAREAAYYSLVVPSNLPSWRVELDTNIGDVLLVLQKDALPNVEGWEYNDPPYFLDGGREMNKVGNDQYLMLPVNGQSNITAGTYYLAVVSDGTNFAHNSTLGSGFSSYTLGSYGTLSVSNLGAPSNTGFSDVGVTNLTLPAGQVSAYTFSVPSNTLSLEIFLTSTTGNPYMTLRTGSQFPGVNDSYGVDGGWTATWASSSLINIANPAATNYTLMVQAEQAGGDSTYTVRVHAIGPQPVVFDNGTASVTNQGVGLWQYFYIVVPSNTFGWDLRLTNINGTTVGQANYPQLYVSRDVAPSSGGPGFNGITSSSWPSGYQWQAAYDWTATVYNADGSYSYSTILAMGMGNPLQAGTYYVGVYNNSSGTNLVSYTLWSRGIGTNFTIPITPLAFSNGVVTNVSGLAPRNADYYTIVVPTNAPNWKIRLTDISGESLLVLQKDALPNVEGWEYNDPAYDLTGGRELIKAGNEQYLMLPSSTASNYVVAGTYYLAVVSQGVNPVGSTIGTNVSFYSLASLGPQGITNLGTVGATDLLQTNALQGGENTLYQFTVPPGLVALEARLDNVSGYPYMTLSPGSRMVQPYNSYGFDGGASAQYYSPTLLTLPNPPGTNFSLTVQASYLSGLYPDADFTVHVREMLAPPLPFDSGINTTSTTNGFALNFSSERYLPGCLGFVLNMQVTPGATNTLEASTNLVNWTALSTFVSPSNSWSYTDSAACSYPRRFYRLQAPAAGASGTLQDGQSAFYTINVPATYNGQPVIGWKLDVTQTSGNASFRVRPGAAPDNGGCDGTSPFVTGEGIYVPPYLTPGLWYIEVRGSGITSYSIVSHNLLLKRPAWTMPAPGGPVTTPGLATNGTLFADTGYDTSGAPLPGDQGTDLANGSFDYYEIFVLSGNNGVLRTRLDAISGNPHLYIRAGAPSTLSHTSAGACGSTLYDRTLNASSGSEYGNWVPLDGRHESSLTNGPWYLAVYAGGNANVRYRLRMDTGNIQPISLNAGSYTNQQMPARDWLYYSAFIPTNAPVNWNIAFNVQLGSVDMYVRDRVPPGEATTVTDYRDWNSDNKNHSAYPNYTSPGTYTLTCPPLRPGYTNYLGFRAIADSTFSVSSSTNGGYINYTNALAFYGGYTTNQIPASGSLKFRIDVPPDATEWIDTATFPSSVWLYLDQGSAPTMTTADDWYSQGSVNIGLDESLVNSNSWPWLPGYSYFLFVTNTSASTQPFSFSMSGVAPEAGPSEFIHEQFLPANAGLQLKLLVNPGWNYLLQYSPDLTNWNNLTSFTALSTNFTYTDTGAPYTSKRFYRLKVQ